jgi:hypothetical protein
MGAQVFTRMMRSIGMSTRVLSVAAAVATGLLPSAVLAQANAPSGDAPPAPSAEAPSPAPDQSPPPAAAPPQTTAPRSAPPGQWVYTQQYGWVWMPYGDAYTYAPPSGDGEPYMYVYYPVVGWTWVVAPWVWGIGPWPFFGVRGPVLFAWYAHGWWRTPARWHFRPAPGLHAPGFRPAPFHNGFVGWGVRGVRPAPVRAAPVRRGAAHR